MLTLIQKMYPDRVAFWGIARWQLAVMAGVAVYVGIAVLIFGMAFRYFSFGAILIGLALSGKAGAQRFLTDWFPLLLFWMGYDWMRDFADEIRPRVAVAGPYQWEVTLFGWLPGNEPPAFFFLRALDGWRWRTLVITLADVFYWSHFVVLPSYMLYLWWHPPTSWRFQRFVYSLTLLHAITLATYFLYPAAPPWYVYYFGFGQPTREFLTNPTMFGAPRLFQSIWAANPNHFAAIPSLHGAYPVLLFLLLERTNRHRRAAVLYGTAVWLATIVRGHHYIIDLLIGAFYAWPCVWLVKRWLREPTPTEISVAERVLP